MVLATLDGMLAVAFDKSSPTGELVNRIAPEIADIATLVGLVTATSAYRDLTWPVLAVVGTVTRWLPDLLSTVLGIAGVALLIYALALAVLVLIDREPMGRP